MIKKTGQARNESEILTRTIERLSTANELSTVTETVASAVRTLVGGDGATFVLREDNFCFYADENAIAPLWKGQKFPLTACVSGWAMIHREVVVIPDIYCDDRIPIDAYRPTFVKSLCMVPIRSSNPIGALGCYWQHEHTPSAEDLRKLQIIANCAAVALENLELRGSVQRRSNERDNLASRKEELESAIHSLVHDLRNPLGVMMGYAELIEDQIGDENTRLIYARSISEAGGQLLSQIDRMLDLYRITNRPIQPEPLNLSLIANELADSFAATYPKRSLEFVIEDDLRTIADPVLARLLLDNLLSNAVKYTGKKSTARIELRRGEDSKGAMSKKNSQTNPLSTFFVKDNGDGFDSKDASRLFRPMTRLHSDDEFPGTGLGLASVARIVELHGGRIRADGKKTLGATFYFTLPACA